MIDKQPDAPILADVFKFIMPCLIALSLLGSGPAIASMGTPAAAQSSDCTMVGSIADQPIHQRKMPCCTTECTMMGMTALAQPNTFELRKIRSVTAAFLTIVKELESLDWATVDPPPRIVLV